MFGISNDEDDDKIDFLLKKYSSLRTEYNKAFETIDGTSIFGFFKIREAIEYIRALDLSLSSIRQDIRILEGLKQVKALSIIDTLQAERDQLKEECLDLQSQLETKRHAPKPRKTPRSKK